MAIPGGWIVGTFTVLFVISTLTDLLTQPPNPCYMTYMRSPPKFLGVQLSENATKLYPDYNLYLYAEGKSEAELFGQPPEGIPLLFVHGNAGQFEQSRSLATILQLKDEMFNHYLMSFAVYTVDFHKELSALYGGFLERQSNFLNECIKAISKQYKLVYPTRPMKIIIVAHSQGGFIARSLYLDPDFDISSIALHVELASPTRRPVFYFDRFFWDFYEKVNNLWKELPHVLPPVLSIMGGEQDVQVKNDLGDSPNALKVRANSIPHCWLSTDHLAIVWCKQLQITLSRALKEVADVIDDRDRIMKILKFHFVRKYAVSSLLSSLPKLPKTVNFARGRKWEEMFDSSWRYQKKRVVSANYLLIPVYKGMSVSFTAYGLKNDDWLFGCTELKKEGAAVSCLSGVDISRQNHLIPPLYRETTDEMFEPLAPNAGRVFSMVSGDIELKKFQAFVISVPAPLENVTIFGERFSGSNKTVIEIDTNDIASGFFQHKQILSMHLSERTTYRKINLINMQHLWKAYKIQVHSKICLDGNDGVSYAKFKNGWSHEEEFFKLKAKTESLSVFTLKLHSYPPYQESHNSSLEFYLDSNCAHDVYLQFDLHAALRHILFYHSEGLFSYCFAFALIVLSKQLADLGGSGVCATFVESLPETSTFITLTVLPTFLEAMSFLPSVPAPLAPYLARLPPTTSATESLAIRVALYWVALGLVGLLGRCQEQTFKIMSSLYIKFKKVTRISWGDAQSIPKESDGSSRLLTATFVAVLALGASIGFGVALIAAYIVHAIQVTSLACQNQYLEDRKGPSGFASRWKFQSTLLLMEFICLPLFIPSFFTCLLTWKPLINDPFIFTGTAIILLMTVLSQPDKPHPHRYYYKTTGYIIFCLGISSVMVAREVVFRLCYLQIIAYAILCVQQFYKP